MYIKLVVIRDRTRSLTSSGVGICLRSEQLFTVERYSKLISAPLTVVSDFD